MAKYPINGEENTRKPFPHGRYIYANTVEREGKSYAGSIQTPGVLGVGDSDKPLDALRDFARKARQYARAGGRIFPVPEEGKYRLVNLDGED